MLLRSWTFFALLMGGAASLPAAVLYRVTDLGTLGLCCTSAYGINNDGQITGESYTAHGANHAFPIAAA